MLVLSRKSSQTVVIGEGIQVTVMRVKGEVVKLGIKAPVEVPVHRQEVYEEIQRCNQGALMSRRSAVPRMPRHNPDTKPKTKLAVDTSAGRKTPEPTGKLV